MIYKIDQSGKAEEVGRDTVLAISNGKSFSIKITARTKVALRKMFGKSGRGKVYVYRVFSILIYLLIVNCGFKVGEVMVDEEYTGQNRLLKDILSWLFIKNKQKMPEIYFARIGNKPKVHYAAYNVFRKKIQADLIVSLKEIMNLTTKKDRGLRRLKNA